MDVIWFKRDLRIRDNEALYEACLNKNVIPLYILEPELWKQPDLSYRHYNFLLECLSDLNNDLKKLGQKLIVRIGDSVEIFGELNDLYNISSIWSHQETWNYWTYERDMRVRNWVRNNKKKIPLKKKKKILFNWI